jgi:hypothetical protein
VKNHENENVPAAIWGAVGFLRGHNQRLRTELDGAKQPAIEDRFLF